MAAVQSPNETNDSELSYSAGHRKIWVDLDNSPHVLFFKPIIKELQKLGYLILITARDRFQVCELADQMGLKYKKIGSHYGKIKIAKAFWLLLRACELLPTIVQEKPDIAISHGSRSQLILSSILRIPSILLFDYEHAKQPVPSTWYIAPEIIPDNAIKGLKKAIIKYPGIKEDVYVPDFMPDVEIKKVLGINQDELVITIRPPAREAHYYNPESERLFEAVVDFLGPMPNVRLILLPRNRKQDAFIRRNWPELFTNGRITIPDHAVDGLNLVWHSDLVISGGGTMNREAAALGVPVYSIFRGKIGAVDSYLSRNGRLTLIEKAEDIPKILLTRRSRPSKPEHANPRALEKIVDEIVNIVEKR